MSGKDDMTEMEWNALEQSASQFKTEWIHKKSLEFIAKGYDSDESYFFAWALFDEKFR